MSGYYYSREAGAEGQILTGEGSAPGVGLDTLLDRERPPCAPRSPSAPPSRTCCASPWKIASSTATSGPRM